MGLTFLYTINMMRFINTHGLLDLDFVLPILGVFLLITIGETI
jgi:hypothetical protein